MKENKYDDERFFELYSRMDRSRGGLDAAGEWHELRKLLPDFRGKRVLDLGCGYGWHCQYALEQGAARVVGVDLSERMLAVAREKAPGAELYRGAIEDVAFPPDTFDAVISSLAFHYVASFGDICRRVRACLTPGGDFDFSVEHPVFTAYGSQDWWYDGEGRRLHWPVDRYFDQGRRDAVFLGERVAKYHRTLTAYVGGLLRGGFTLTGLVEPEPAPHLLKTVPGMEAELRRPMMLLVAAKRT